MKRDVRCGPIVQMRVFKIVLIKALECIKLMRLKRTIEVAMTG
jgi:hypothetical protein